MESVLVGMETLILTVTRAGETGMAAAAEGAAMAEDMAETTIVVVVVVLEAAPPQRVRRYAQAHQ